MQYQRRALVDAWQLQRLKKLNHPAITPRKSKFHEFN